MPLYDYECAKCSKIEEHYRCMNDVTIACECGGEMRRQISPRYYINRDIDIVTDNIDGKMRRVSSHRELRQLCKDNDVEQKFGKGWI